MDFLSGKVLRRYQNVDAQFPKIFLLIGGEVFGDLYDQAGAQRGGLVAGRGRGRLHAGRGFNNLQYHGDRQFDTDAPAELAVVVVGFDDTGKGRVRVRGETWRARQAENDRASLDPGAVVRVVARDGLTLVVAAEKR